MRKATFLSLGLLLAAFGGAAAETDRLAEIGRRMAEMPCFVDSCAYEVLLPTLSEPVKYSLAVESAAVADSLAPCSYIISWSLPAPTGVRSGFSAYFDGTHFRFMNERLQEYHLEWDAASFAPSGNVADGVQRRAQFADILPQFIGENFVAMSTDTTYTWTIREGIRYAGRDAVRVEGVRRLAGFDALEFEYTLDASTFTPLHIDLENNPGQLGEQNVTVTFGAAASSTACNIGMDRLLELHGAVLQHYRESSFSLEELVGRPMPRITLPTADGSRYIHHKGEPLAATTLFVIVDCSVGSTPDVIAAVRKAVDYLPLSAEVVWTFLDRRADDVLPLVQPLRPGETAAINGGSAARDCGVGSLTPVIIIASPDGNVADFIRGYNQDLESLVIQKTTLANGRI